MVRQNKHLYGIAVLQIFTPDECANIIKNALNNWTEGDGVIAYTSDQTVVKNLDLRNTTLFTPPKSDKEAVWCKKIIDHILSINNDKEGYGFDIFGMVEAPAMLR